MDQPDILPAAHCGSVGKRQDGKWKLAQVSTEYQLTLDSER